MTGPAGGTGSHAPPRPQPVVDRAVVEEWTRRVEAEYRSAALAHLVTLALIQAGAPPDLIRDGLRVVDDELKHSELSWEVAATAGAVAPPRIDADSLTPAGGGDRITALALSIGRSFCIGETVAVPLFRMLRSAAEEVSAQRALDVILRDEGRHRQFGWDVLDWLISTDDRVVPLLVDHLPSMVDGVRAAYGSQPEAPPLAPAAARWGLASPADYARILDTVLDREVLPRFAARDIRPPQPAGQVGPR